MLTSSSKLNLFRLVYAVPVWAAFLVLQIVLIIVGALICPPLLWYGLKQREWPWVFWSNTYKHFYAGFPDWAYLWSNESDSVLGPSEYAAKYPAWSPLKRAIMWTCVRNVAPNARFVPVLSHIIEPAKVRFTGSYETAESFEAAKGTPYWFLCWTEGTPYAAFRLQYFSPISGQLREFWVGTRIWPIDYKGVSLYRRDGAAWTIQWRTL